ncbi:lytic polysaccharide monooxygenase [Actinokineospora sp. UTMC 2448]|uniref:lytic polysaccharide monooxygenase n=1 Tax=Actinokineospora sp. UTMC 2448 TaxID=2268449 RepID=UPI00216435FC|nr:lytic polysaccharide monooxygenase [Actinokineospora sp. UTMC 2448]UVS80061.1 Endoglucanase E-4 precursor [Actinokineospora sp. UTMC 2448]
MRTRRNGALLAGLVGVLTAGGILIPTTTAQAHGGMTFPATRTYACYVDGRAGGGGGDLAPQNDACEAAVAISGKQPLWDWFGNLISLAGGRHREIIADGDLCGPTAKYDGFNIAHSAWPTTTLQANSQVTFRYNAWAPHPGTWSQYVTRDGWDPSQPLKWSDLEPAPFNAVTNPPINGSGPEGAEYTWPVTLPNKSGRHIIYSIWQRSDSPEAFYNCSDVVFTGGSGGGDTVAPSAPGTPSASGITASSAQLSWAASTDNTGVTGYEVYRENGADDTLLASTTTNSASLTGLTASTAYRVYVVAKDAAGNRSAASAAGAFTTSSGDGPGGSTCRVAHTVSTTWNGGFTGTVRITNTGTAAVSGWTLTWDYPGGQQVTQAWNATVSQSGTQVTARNASWNGSIAPSATVEFGFNGSAQQGAQAPGGFALNGTACAVS